MPTYHRADIGVNIDTKKKKRYESSWNFSIYNLYARENAYTITFSTKKIIVDGKEVDTKEPQAEQVALFKIIPSVTWNFKF